MEIIKTIKKELNNNPDLTIRKIDICNKKIYLIFYNSVIDKELFSQAILTPILRYKEDISYDVIFNKILSVPSIDIVNKNSFVKEITKNRVILFIDGEEKGVSIDIENIPTRQPSEPPTSPTIQGPREGFTENVKTTISLMRKKLPTKDLVIKNFYIGSITNTQVSVFYLNNLADKKLINKIEKKLNKINTDGILDAHYLVNYLTDKPNSMFEQFGLCEKPDIVTAKLLEGRVAIAVDGSPIVITLPFVVFEDLQNSNDYYTNAHYSTFVRIIRALGVLMATVIPGIYLSFRLYHYKVVPLKYILTINATTQNLPFTPFIELLFILILFQMLYEVSLRLPRYLGIATSIVGALVLGDTGVQAGLISPPGTIVIALSLISVYTVPNQAPQLTLMRFVFLLLGGTLGLFGVVAGSIYFVNYLCCMNEFNVSTLAPYAPRVSDDLKDGLIRKPITKMNKRPKSIKNYDIYRGIGGKNAK